MSMRIIALFVMSSTIQVGIVEYCQSVKHKYSYCPVSNDRGTLKAADKYF